MGIPWLDPTTVSKEPRRLPQHGKSPAEVHIFDEDSVYAVNLALAAGRPLLLRGEPGAGKSQLARATAVALRRALVSKVIDSRTEAQDLFWTIDSVERLARAQVLGALGALSAEAVRSEMALERFLEPGPIWWAYDWDAATKVSPHHVPEMPGPDCSADQGVVVLIDEIDKADSDVPNGLLQALGTRSFPRPDGQEAISAASEPPPLVIFTTNEERSLPAAFLRRCVVHHLELPTDRGDLVKWLSRRGEAHFPQLAPSTLEEAAGLLVADREKLKKLGLSLPGQAEYLDLLRALAQRAGDDSERQRFLLGELAKFVFRKHPREA